MIRYSATHQWARPLEASPGAGPSSAVPAGPPRLRVGITAFAVGQLQDVVYIDLPAPGALLQAGEPFCTVEGVKTDSPVHAPVSGRIAAVNRALTDRPELMNDDPEGAGWIAEVEGWSEAEFAALLDRADYAKLV